MRCPEPSICVKVNNYTLFIRVLNDLFHTLSLPYRADYNHVDQSIDVISTETGFLVYRMPVQKTLTSWKICQEPRTL